ncbi:hypothetical protein B0H14DRAFT_2605304 [Mycena olivaceomarginata]|nr:hypothetical protein B0H14DRAFT_2605304 [Mycena olivaceomarginata]
MSRQQLPMIVPVLQQINLAIHGLFVEKERGRKFPVSSGGSCQSYEVGEGFQTERDRRHFRVQFNELVMVEREQEAAELDAPGPARVQIPSTPLQRDQLALWICQIADPVKPMCRPPFGSCFLRPWVKIPHQTSGGLVGIASTYKRGICLNVVCVNAFLPGAVVTPNIWVKVSLDRLLVAVSQRTNVRPKGGLGLDPRGSLTSK